MCPGSSPGKGTFFLKLPLAASSRDRVTLSSARTPVVNGDRAVAERIRRDQLQQTRVGQPALVEVGPWSAIPGWTRNLYS